MRSTNVFDTLYKMFQPGAIIAEHQKNFLAPLLRPPAMFFGEKLVAGGFHKTEYQAAYRYVRSAAFDELH